jgi:Na+-driven multidrug efflux pump
VTGLVGRFGTAALAGYGIGARLEIMLGPLAFGVGSGLTTLVGVAAGANAWQRAVRATWIGGLISFCGIGVIGWTVALSPERWARLFTSDSAVISASTAYIVHVAPFYCLLGLGLTLYFASQGAGRMAIPVTASLARTTVTIVGGWILVNDVQLGLDGVFTAIAAGIITYACLISGALLIAPWQKKPIDDQRRSGLSSSVSGRK